MASKSLGTLTIDLVARVGGFVQGMDKAERASAKWRKQVEKDAKVIGTAVGAASAAAITGLAAMTVSTVKAAGEVSRFAAISGAGVEEFQRYAAAADVVGISQEKLSDQLKDFNEKVGEFQQSGGGGMKDFFEQIAPQIGITADAFKGLSGPQGLQLYYNSLEKAGLSQDQMSFYLESMASDTTALIPLLRDGGAGFKLLGDAASAAGAVMDGETIRAANELSAATTLLRMAADGASNQIMQAMLPALSDMAAELVGVSAEGEAFTAIGDKIVSVLKLISSAGVGAYSTFQLTGKGLAGLAFIASEVPNGFEAVSKAAALVRDELEETALKAGEAIEAINNAGSSGGTNPKVSAIADILDETSRAAKGAGIAISSAATKSAEATQKQVEALQKQADTLGMSAEALAIYNLEQAKASDGQMAQARAALETISAYEKQKKQTEAYAELVASLRTEEEQLTDQLRERLAVLDAMQGIEPDERMKVAGRIAGAATTDAPEFGGLDAAVGGPFGELLKIDEAEERLQEWYDTQLEMLEQFRQDRADLSAVWDEEELALKQQHEDELARIEQARQMAQLASAESIFGDLAGLTKTFAGEQSGLYKAMFAVQKAAAIAQSAVAIQQGIAMAAANPWPLNLAAMASVAAATASIVSNIGAIGMAHEGIDAIPETGTWLLEKGERVTTAETSAKLDKTLSDIQSGGAGGPTNVQIINNGEPMTARAQMDGDTLKIIMDRVNQSILADGEVHQAISRKYGIQGVGR
ncbi:phage tail tape measure protein [Stutzerimonas stutzeri]|uniref:phage tail tape measure protein n=1 Tax=Stutzerimonas stutzeri TaxID=316 RepID=UPI003C2D7F65